jgi:hypothetical protein
MYDFLVAVTIISANWTGVRKSKLFRDIILQYAGPEEELY